MKHLNAILSVLVVFSPGNQALAGRFDYSTKLSPTDYLLRSQDQHKDPVFDNYRVIDLGASVGIGSDCGRMDFRSTLRASLKNVLDAKYFGDMGKDILAASPMLLTCYFSPTWCAILKHSQVNANMLSQMRLDQCSIVDKYVDNRVEDFYQERQGCVRQAIERNGGDIESAMQQCQGNRLWDSNLANWAGKRNGEKVESNRLIDSSAKWAGLNGSDQQGTLQLVKEMVGDTVVSRGVVSVEYGPQRQSALSPRNYLQKLEKSTYEQLCTTMMVRLSDAGPGASSDRVISDTDLQALSPGYEYPLIDRQTIRALQIMPPKQREMSCRKITEALSMTLFSNDVSKSLDMLSTLAQNPNLPPNRKEEIEQKRKTLKDSVEMTLSLQKERNQPLNQVLSQVSRDGARYADEAVQDDLDHDASHRSRRQVESSLMNCDDGVMCAGRRN